MSNPPFDGSGGPPQSENEALLLLGWNEFCKECPDEQTSVETLWKVAPRTCNKCKGHDIVRAYGERIGRCRECNAEVRLTAGTFFNGVRNIRAWLAAIWLIEYGVSLNSQQLERLGGVVQSTAWNILTKLRMVLGHDIGTSPIALQVNLGIFRTVFAKRSLETPAHEHPASEQTEVETKWLAEKGSLEEGEIGENESSDGAAFGGAPEGELADLYACISDSPEKFDILIVKSELDAQRLGTWLEMLQLGGWIERLPGDQYRRLRPSHSVGNGAGRPELLGMTIDDGSKADIIEYLASTFHGISRKYVQLYLASYWCKHDRKRWSAGNLLKACCRLPEINDLKIRSYVSPLFGNIVLPQQTA